MARGMIVDVCEWETSVSDLECERAAQNCRKDCSRGPKKRQVLPIREREEGMKRTLDGTAQGLLVAAPTESMGSKVWTIGKEDATVIKIVALVIKS